ncbi:hypothetical protein Tco_0961392, partial [Tanacetum coccineum]
GKNNLFSIKLHHGGKVHTSSTKKDVMFVGKVNYVDTFDVDSLQCGCTAYVFQEFRFDKLNGQTVRTQKGQRLPFKSTVEIEELDDDVLLNAPVVGSSKRLALGWINEADVGESSVGKNDNVNVVGSSKSLALGWVNKADVDGNVHEEQTINVNDYTIDDMFELDIDENLNLDDYKVYVDENMNENVNIDENVDENMNENVNADDENVNADDEYEQDDVEDEEVIGNDREDFIVDEEHVIDEVEVNMEGDDTASITRRSLRKLRKNGGQSCGIVNTLFVGQEFANKELAKARIKAYAVETRRKIGIVKNDSERLQDKCKGNVVESGNSVSQGNLSHACGAVVGDNLEWVVRTLKNDHLCQQSREIRACTSTFLSQHVVDLLHTNPQIPIKAVQEHMQKQFQVGVSKTKAFRAKTKAEKANLNTTVKIDVYRAHNPRENVRRFKRIYVCLGAFERQLLGLDGAFMKGNYPGQLLTAVSVDANNGIYHVAYGIVESESKESWTWFLSCLGDDLNLEANLNFTFITDRQKGLLPALKDLFPAAEHRYCVKHIHDNMNLIFKGGHYKELLWKCATATTEVHFEREMDEFKGYNRLANEWLRKIPPKHWSRS